MTPDELRDEVAVEFDALDLTLTELKSLQADLAGRDPTLREKAAAAAFLAQLYSGVENVLKRISQFYGVALPSGENWHVELFIRFCKPGCPPLPVLFDDSLAVAMTPYRKFRHVFHHGYSFQLDWERMREGVERAEDVFSRFKARVNALLAELD